MTRTLVHPRPDRTSVWGEALKHLRDRIPEREFRTWVEPAQWLDDRDGEVRLLVPNPTFAAHLEGRYERLLLDALQSAGSRAAAIRCFVDHRQPAGAGASKSADEGAGRTGRPPASTRSDALSPAYTFEAFVRGRTNGCAQEAALAVCDPDTPSTAFTPLLIHGAVGVGKTHLLQSIAWRLREEDRSRRILYVRGESFGRQVVNAVRTNALYAFREECQQLDALLVDDLQFLAGLDRFSRSTEEFFHALTGLVERDRIVVVSANRHPQHIENLDPRIRSRLESGLVADIGPPEWNTRVNIVRQKATARAVELPAGAAEKIASRFREGPRGLEGALSRIAAVQRSERVESLSMEIVERVLAEAPLPVPQETRTPEVIGVVASAFGLPPVRLVGRYRGHEVSLARHVAMFIAREITGDTLSTIGAAFRRNHSSVVYGIERVKRQRGRDPGLDRLVARLRRRFR